MTRVLIVDDDPVQLRLTADIASHAGFGTVTASGGKQALELLRSDPGIGAMVLDLVMPDLDGMAVLETMQREEIKVPVIIQTATSSLEIVVSAMRQGATDFFIKPVAPERLTVSLRNALRIEELETLVRSDRNRRAGTLGPADVIARSPAMDRVLLLCGRAAKNPIPVLLEGEAGIGKQRIARVIHGMSERAGKPFITVNCGAIPANLIDSALFGHRKGAFIGAAADQAGKFAEARGGTLFLEEVGELTLETQAKLLLVLQEGEIAPAGAPKPERVNVRVIAATNQRLLNLAKSGAFREDLYYRLNVFPIYVPPLRDRREDIAALVGYFIARLAAETGKRTAGIAPPALELLTAYNWPGNIRQLENAIYRAILLSETAFLELADFPQILAQTSSRADAVKLLEAMPAPADPVHIDQALLRPRTDMPWETVSDRFLDANGEVAPLADLERDLIAFALHRYDGRMSRIARALGIGRSTLYRKLREYGLDDGIESQAA